MIVPIGHEEESVRRVPWATFGIMSLCAAAFVLTTADAASAKRHADETLRHAAEYYLDHPYLQWDETLRSRLMREDEGTNGALREGLALLGGKQDRATTAAEQAELDRLMRAAEAAAARHPLRSWGFVPSHLTLLTLLSHMFLHAGWFHLLGNMLILYLGGPYIEDVWGRPLFGTFYLASGIVSALTFALGRLDSDVPMIGASGAIAGVMGAFFIRYRRTRIRFFYLFAPSIRGTFDAPAWVILPVWFCQQLFMAMMAQRTGAGDVGGIAYLAHVAGFGFGAATAFAIAGSGLEERILRPVLEAKTSTVVIANPVLDRALEERTAGRPESALAMLASEAARLPADGAVALAYWDLALEQNRAAEAAPALERVIRRDLAEGRADLALQHWVDLVGAVEAPSGLPLSSLMRLAQMLAQQGRRLEATEAARRALDRVRSGRGRAADPVAILRLAELASRLDDGMALEAARIASEGASNQPEVQDRAQRLLASLSRGQP